MGAEALTFPFIFAPASVPVPSISLYFRSDPRPIERYISTVSGVTGCFANMMRVELSLQLL
jgi:hypothetical protein